ncbi:hypothetical protein BSZ28_19445 [Pseudomonas moraviensis]|nr:hypothetical protein BSZ28_19445 [Pseudomonas moraviensis]
MNFKYRFYGQIYVGINNVRVKGIQPLPVSSNNLTIRTRNDETESPTPPRIALSKYSIQHQVCMLVRLNEKGYP